MSVYHLFYQVVSRKKKETQTKNLKHQILHKGLSCGFGIRLEFKSWFLAVWPEKDSSLILDSSTLKVAIKVPIIRRDFMKVNQIHASKMLRTMANTCSGKESYCQHYTWIGIQLCGRTQKREVSSTYPLQRGQVLLEQLLQKFFVIKILSFHPWIKNFIWDSL